MIIKILYLIIYILLKSLLSLNFRVHLFTISLIQKELKNYSLINLPHLIFIHLLIQQFSIHVHQFLILQILSILAIDSLFLKLKIFSIIFLSILNSINSILRLTLNLPIILTIFFIHQVFTIYITFLNRSISSLVFIFLLKFYISIYFL